MNTFVLKRTSDESFFINFRRGSDMWKTVLLRYPNIRGEGVRVIQLAYCDDLFTAECVRVKRGEKR